MTASNQVFMGYGFGVWKCRARLERNFHPKSLTDPHSAPPASDQACEESQECLSAVLLQDSSFQVHANTVKAVRTKALTYCPTL